MIRKTRLFTPGPTPLLPAAQFAMAAADIHHRTPEFRALFQKVLAQLKVFVGTKNDVLLLSSSGTGAMEASVSNLTSPGDRVLVLTAGKFGERWADLTKAFGCQVDLVKAPYGQTFDLAEIKAGVKAGASRCLYAGHGDLDRGQPRRGSDCQTGEGDRCTAGRGWNHGTWHIASSMWTAGESIFSSAARRRR